MQDDILNYERLLRDTPREPLELSYRSQPTTATQNRAFVAGLLTISTLVFSVATFGIFSFGLQWLSPWTLFIFAGFGLFVAIVLAVKRQGPQTAIAALAAIVALPLVFAGISLVFRLNHGGPLLLALATAICLIVLMDKAAGHYVGWLLADHRLKSVERKSIQNAWDHRFAMLRRRKPDAAAPGWLRLYPLAFLAPLVFLVPVPVYPVILEAGDRLGVAVLYAAVIPVLFVLTFFAPLLRPSRGRAVRQGLLTWLTYGWKQVDAPAVFRGTLKTATRRIMLTMLAGFLLSVVILPATGFFSFLPLTRYDPAGDVFLRALDSPVSATVAYIKGTDFYVSPLDSNDQQAVERWGRINSQRLFAVSPVSWVPLATDGVTYGKSFYAWTFLVAFAMSLAVPTAVMMVCLGLTLAVVASSIVPLTERPDVRYPDTVTDWQCYADRLRSSTNALERQHLFLGVHAYADYPVILDHRILGEHAYIVGDTGSGKTALGLTPIVLQLLRIRPDQAASPAVVIIDLKGDQALFHSVREEAAAAGREFKFFTNELAKATFAFNPFVQAPEETLSLNQVCENILEALNLNHGEGYGRSYFSRVARRWLNSILKTHPHVRSFTELYELANNKKNFRSDSEQDDTLELISVIETLASFDQLNVGSPGDNTADAAKQAAIYMPDVLTKGQVVYFWLPAIIESASVREIAKLAIYALVRAAFLRTTNNGPRSNAYLVIDEFQRIASHNFKIILEQARSMGIGVILANQTVADLKTHDGDLRPAVFTNTRFKQCFSAIDLEQQDLFMKASGEATDFRKSYTLAPTPGIISSIGPGQFGLTSLGLQEYTRPRLQRNDLIRASDDPLQSIVQIHRGSGYTQFAGFSVPLRTLYPLTQSTYERRNREAWPAETEQTLTVRRQPFDTSHQFTTTDERIEAGKQVAAVLEEEPGESYWSVELERLRKSLSTRSERSSQSPSVEPLFAAQGDDGSPDA